MVVTDLESLSLQELTYIATREGLELSDSLSREDIIEELVEYYDDNNIQLKENKTFVGDDRRFISSLVSLQGKIDIKSIQYAYGPKTSVHFLLESPSWAFIYWNISNRDLVRLGVDNIESLILHCTTTENYEGEVQEERTETFDIEVSVKDTNWSLSFQRGEIMFSIELQAKLKDGTIESLCSSDAFKMPMAWYSHNPDYLVENEKAYQLAISSLVTKGGNIVDNAEVKSIMKCIEGGDTCIN